MLPSCRNAFHAKRGDLLAFTEALESDMAPEKAVSECAEGSTVCAGVASISISPLCAVAATMGRPSPFHSPAARIWCSAPLLPSLS